MRSRLGGLSLLLLILTASADPADGQIPKPQEQTAEETGQGSWTRVMSPVSPPSSSERITTVYDAAHDRLLLLRDEWDLWVLPLGQDGSWQSVPTSGEPPDVVRFHSVVLDTKEDRFLVFGGITAGGLRSNGVWVLSLKDGPRWSRLVPAGTSPAARSHHGAAYDPLNDRMIVVGGNGGNDVWALELAETPKWRVLPTSGPSPAIASQAHAVYDSPRGRVIVTLRQGYRMTAWGLSLGEQPRWTELSPPEDGPRGPNSIIDEWGLYADPLRDRLLMVWLEGNLGFPNVVWELSLSGAPVWRVLASGGLPLNGSRPHSAAFDLSRERLLLQSDLRSETWGFGSDRLWHQLAGPPRGRHGHVSVYDPLRRRMLLMAGQSAHYFAGSGFMEYDGRIWQLSLDDLVWTLTDENSPSLEDYAAVHDPLGDRVIGIGGMSLYYPGCHPPYDPPVPGYQYAPWAIPLSGGSSGQVPGSAFGVHGHSAVLDTRRNRVLVFGGVTDSWYCDHNARLERSYNNRLRVLALADPAGWSEVTTPEDGPGPRAWHGAVYDEDRDRVWMWGGAGASDELWQLDLADGFAWTRVMVEGEAPSPTTRHSMIYDPVRQRLVVFGGSPGSDPAGSARPWVLSLEGQPRWERLAPTGEAPPERGGHSAIYDPVNDQMVIFGGDPYRNDAWILRWGDPLQRVTIDVRPGDPRNTLSPKGQGVLPIAILGAAGFDAPAVDLRTVTVSGARPARDGNDRIVFSTTDVNGDGLQDLTFHVGMESLRVDSGNPQLRLDGRTSDGRRIRGTDQVRLVRNPHARPSSEPLPGPALGMRHAGMHPAAGRLAGPIVATLPHAQPGVLEVFSVTGRRIHSRTIGAGTHRLDLSSLGPLKPGIYALRLTQAGQSAHLRMVVLND